MTRPKPRSLCKDEYTARRSWRRSASETGGGAHAVAVAVVLVGLLALLGGCDDLLPIQPIDRCGGENPPEDCSCADDETQMQADLGTRAASCPECLTDPPHRDCANSPLLPAGNGGAGGRGGTGGATGQQGAAGARAGAGGTQAGAGGSAGVGGSGAAGAQAGAGGADPCASCGADQHCLAGSCVQCRDDDDCDSDDAPRCDLIAHTCVACLEHADCKDPENGQCLDHACVPCQDSSHCQGDPSKPNCEPQSHACVECVTHGNCLNAERPQCNADFACEACTEDVACAGRGDTTVCDDVSNSSSRGQCVECTGAKYLSCRKNGTDYVCNSRERTCSSTAIKGSALNCKPCVSDAHCGTGRLCMPMTFAGSAELGTFCLWRETASNGTDAPAGDCTRARKYVATELDWTSVDGVAEAVCKPRTTTCEAVETFNGRVCSGLGPQGDADCGVDGVNDGICAPWGGGFSCTYPCTQELDCPNLPGINECDSVELGSNGELNICLFQ